MTQIKECFVSRFDGGKLVQFDYSQIEVVVLAFLSGDANLKQDVRDGMDLHCKRLAYKLGETYDVVKRLYDGGDKTIKAMRTEVKGISFKRSYGAGATSIAKSMGISKEDAEDFIRREEELYPSVVEYQNRCYDAVKRSRTPSIKRSPSGLPLGSGRLLSVTGRRYCFYEYESKYKEKTASFSPTEVKNYPVQGLAGELLRIAYGDVAERLISDPDLYEHAKLVNTVHDSIVLDVDARHPDILRSVVALVHDAMINVPTRFGQLFDVEFDLPLRVEVEIGDDLFNVEKLDSESVYARL